MALGGKADHLTQERRIGAFSKSARRAIVSSVIVVVLQVKVLVSTTQPYPESPRWPLTGPPSPDSWRSLRRAAQMPPTPRPGARPRRRFRVVPPVGIEPTLP